MRAVALALLIGACGFGGAPDAIDAGRDALAPADAAMPSDAFACVHVHLDAGGWGEACSRSGLCHGELGWCIDGACRPQCVQPLACLACEGTAQHTSTVGQCYCAP